MDPDRILPPEAFTNATGVEPMSVSAPLSVWKQMDLLLSQMEEPAVVYDADQLKMAQAVISDLRTRANMVRRLIPAAVND